MAGFAAIQVEGLQELQQAIRAHGDKELPKALGRVNREIGRFVISKLEPPVVGEGAGARVRPSASQREVLLRVGGGHRDARAKQWGKRQTWEQDGDAPERPDIIGTASAHRGVIERLLLDGIERALKPPFQ